MNLTPLDLRDQVPNEDWEEDAEPLADEEEEEDNCWPTKIPEAAPAYSIPVARGWSKEECDSLAEVPGTSTLVGVAAA